MGDNEKYADPIEMLDDLHKSGKAIMTKKNHDYRGGSGDPYANFRGSSFLEVDPIIGILLRVQDKMMRVKTFVEKGELKVSGESVKDALIDVTNYMALIWGLVCEGKKAENTVFQVEDGPPYDTPYIKTAPTLNSPEHDINSMMTSSKCGKPSKMTED